MSSSDSENAPQSLTSRLKGWGSSALPPMGLATLITALHYRPFQALPMVFAPLLLFGSYLNLGGFVIDSAGMTAAWSGLYVLLAARRRPGRLAGQFRSGRLSARGFVRGAAMGVGAVNCVAGAWVYATGDREAETMERRERNRWGVYKD